MTCQGEHLFQHQIAWGSPPHSGFSALSRNSVVFLEVVSFHFCRQVGERNGGEEDDRVADQVTHLVGGGCRGERCSRYTPPNEPFSAWPHGAQSTVQLGDMFLTAGPCREHLFGSLFWNSGCSPQGT